MHQHRRREGVSRRGRGGLEGASRGRRRGRRRRARRAVRSARRRDRRAGRRSAPRPTSTRCRSTAARTSRATRSRAPSHVVDAVVRTAAGKADYAWAREIADHHESTRLTIRGSMRIPGAHCRVAEPRATACVQGPWRQSPPSGPTTSALAATHRSYPDRGRPGRRRSVGVEPVHCQGVIVSSGPANSGRDRSRPAPLHDRSIAAPSPAAARRATSPSPGARRRRTTTRPRPRRAHTARPGASASASPASPAASSSTSTYTPRFGRYGTASAEISTRGATAASRNGNGPESCALPVQMEATDRVQVAAELHELAQRALDRLGHEIQRHVVDRVERRLARRPARRGTRASTPNVARTRSRRAGTARACGRADATRCTSGARSDR